MNFWVVLDDLISWRLAATNLWRTVAPCMRPEPRHLLLSGWEDTEKRSTDRLFGIFFRNTKGWRPM